MPDSVIVAPVAKKNNSISKTIQYGVAASLLGAILIVKLTFNESVEIYKTEIGEHARYALQDSSIMHLNTASIAIVQFDQDLRKVVLEEGEAYFEVKKDLSRPFVVVAGLNSVTAVGTAFNVKNINGHTSVTVTEGLVSVAAMKSNHSNTESIDVHSVLIRAGEQINIKGHNLNINPVLVKSDKIIEWSKGVLIFDQVRLKKVISELDRYYSEQLTIEDPALENLIVNAVFKIDDKDEILVVLSNALPIEFEYVSDSVIKVVPRRLVY